MINFCINHFDTIITVSVTIIGLIITYKNTKKSFEAEISKSKISNNIELMHELPYELCQMMSKIQKSNGKVSQDAYEKLFVKIFVYGSKDAVKIATEIQQTFYEIAKTDSNHGQELLILFSLLIVQLKFDISDEIISPEEWFRFKINDYTEQRESFKIAINKMVSKLELESKFYV